jgi:hypothetical protein
MNSSTGYWQNVSVIFLGCPLSGQEREDRVKGIRYNSFADLVGKLLHNLIYKKSIELNMQ